MEPLDKHVLAGGFAAPQIQSIWPTPGALLADSWAAPGPLLECPWPTIRSCPLLVRSWPTPGALPAHSWRAPGPLLTRSWPTPVAFLPHFGLQNCGHATKLMSPHAGPMALDLLSGCSWPTPGPLLAHSWNAAGPPLVRSCPLLVRSWPTPGALPAHSWCVPGLLLTHSWPTPVAFLPHFCLQNSGQATKPMSPHAGPVALDLHSGCSWPTPLSFCPSLVRSRLKSVPTTRASKRVLEARQLKIIIFKYVSPPKERSFGASPKP